GRRLGPRAALLLPLWRRWRCPLHLLPWLRRRLPLLALLCCAAPLRLRLWSRAALLLMLLCRWLRLLRLLRRLRRRLPLRTLVLRGLLCRRGPAPALLSVPAGRCAPPVPA